MNVIVSNKQSDVLFNLDLDVIKNVTGEYTANEIVEMFKNLFFDKLILDVTALKNYEDSNSYTFFKDNFDLNKIILFLPQDSTVCSPSFLSNFVKLGIYNFTTNVNGIKFLINKSNTYENVASLLQYSNTGATIVNENVNTKNKDIISNDKKHDVEQKKVKVVKSANKQLKIIGFINATVHAGSTSLIYMLQKELQKVYGKSGVVAIEVNRHDFQYFGNNSNMFACTGDNLVSIIRSHQDAEVILVDFNDYRSESVCTDTVYLVEPSVIRMNRLVRNRMDLLKKLTQKKVILNKCLLSKGDISDFKSETGIDVVFEIPPLNDRVDNSILNELCSKLGLVDKSDDNTNSETTNGIFSIFNR